MSAAGRIGSTVVLALALLAAGCASSGEDSPSCNSLVFSPALMTPAAGDVFLLAPLNTCSDIYVNVMVNELSGVWTASFDLTYPVGVVQYVSGVGTCVVGPLLTKQGPSQTPICLATETSPGHLTVSVTRFLPDPGVTASGTELLATVRLRRVAAGNGTIDFDTGASTGAEQIQDEFATVRPATFGPGHGGLVSVP